MAKTTGKTLTVNKSKAEGQDMAKDTAIASTTMAKPALSVVLPKEGPKGVTVTVKSAGRATTKILTATKAADMAGELVDMPLEPIDKTAAVAKPALKAAAATKTKC